jgi:hypothetical protein
MQGDFERLLLTLPEISRVICVESVMLGQTVYFPLQSTLEL